MTDLQTVLTQVIHLLQSSQPIPMELIEKTGLLHTQASVHVLKRYNNVCRQFPADLSCHLPQAQLKIFVRRFERIIADLQHSTKGNIMDEDRKEVHEKNSGTEVVTSAFPPRPAEPVAALEARASRLNTAFGSPVGLQVETHLKISGELAGDSGHQVAPAQEGGALPAAPMPEQSPALEDEKR